MSYHPFYQGPRTLNLPLIHPAVPKMPDYPGLGLPLRHNPDDFHHYPIGAHGSCHGSKSDLLPVRELAMMSVMESLTDKEDWHKKVFDDAVVSKWREEALAIPDEQFNTLAKQGKHQYWRDGTPHIGDDGLGNRWDQVLRDVLNTSTFDHLIKELRSKAKYYEKSSIIPTLDACASVAKSDKLVTLKLHEALLEAFETLTKDRQSAPDWHPNSNEMVQDMVHPSMYPLVYGRTRVLKEEVVGVDDAINKWAGKGSIVPKDDWEYDPVRDQFQYGVGGANVPPQFWSNTYQWLPANVAFQKDGSVKFTSYINNIHPNKYPDVYRTIEKLIQTSLPIWDQCLAINTGFGEKDGAGRTKSRVPYPDNPDDENKQNWDPSNPQAVADVKLDWEKVAGRFQYDPDYDDETEKKWQVLRKPVIPEIPFTEVDYAPESEKRLAEKFAQSGLQVIVKIASIELTPENPEFPVGGWHVEGQMNEHICATALYYLESENITSSSLSFRMQTDSYLNDDISVGQDSYSWLEQIYGTSLSPGQSPSLQNYGSVETRQGRLLAFPNVFQHRVSPFRLEDPTKPGHRRFIALWLVDPTIRVISTSNVPPQQMDWWLDSVFGETSEARQDALTKLPVELVALMKEKGLDLEIPTTTLATLPQELMDMVRSDFEADSNALPMGLEEARKHRIKLMDARKAFVADASEAWHQHTYSFCEH